MAAEIPTPVCEVTALPLPILPPGPRENGAFSIPKSADKHHAWHSRKDVLALGTGGLALRNSRIQLTNWKLHHLGYHEIFTGPPLPQNEGELFRLTVLSAAGVVPRHALDLSNRGEYEITELDDEQHAKISNAVSIQQKKPISRFFADYAKNQDILSSNPNMELKIEEFLDRRTDGFTKRTIASELLGTALDLSIDNLGLTEQHKELKEMGYIRAPKPKTFRHVAKSIVRLGYLDYFRVEMENQLASL